MSKAASVSKPQVVLASQSPRRRDYLERMGVSFVVRPADIPEPLPQHITPKENAKRLSLEKAEAVYAQIRDDTDISGACVLASDTIVAIDGEQLAKPIDRDDAERMLRSLLDRVSIVATGVALINGASGERVVDVETTEVHFRSVEEPGVVAALETYLDSGDWRDKAGAYGIQSGAGPLIGWIKGEYATIVGLPIEKTRSILAPQGVQTASVVDIVPEGIEQRS